MKYDEFNIVELSEVSNYITEKISGLILNKNNYISTTNMNPNRGGITADVVVPEQNVNKFMINDILISNIRPYFKKIWYANFSGGASTDVLIIRTNNKINSKYLYYNLMSDNFFDYSMKGSKGTKMPRGDKEHIMKYPIPIVSLVTQQSIINILSSLDNKIELNNKINYNLEELAQTLYKHWFVDFEFPNEEGLPYKSSGGKMVDSEIGLIPEGWEVKTLNKLVKQHRIKKDPDQNRKLIDLANMPSYSLTLDRFDNGDKLKTNIYEMKINNFIYGSIRPYLGKFGIVPYDGLTTGTIHQFNVKNKLEYSTIASIIFSKTFNDFCIKLSHGTKMPVINWNQFSSYKVIYNKVIFEKFNDITQSYYKTIVTNINENISLVEMRDLLLPKLMSGEIRVPIKE